MSESTSAVREEGAELEAGRQLDALVAERVMGWTACDPNERSDRWEFADDISYFTGIGIEPGGRRYVIPEYSTDMGAAWEVAEKLAPTFYVDMLSLDYASWIGWKVQIRKRLPGHGLVANVMAATAPLAIARAALKARPPQPEQPQYPETIISRAPGE